MIKNALLTIVLAFFVLSCSSLLKYDKSKGEFKNEEFDKQVKIVEPVDADDAQSEAKIADPTTVSTLDAPKSVSKAVVVKKPVKVKKATKQTPVVPLTRQPDIEDSEGFIDNQRRPLVDPFKVGERVTHEVTYLGATAGELILSVKPFATVNGRKNYNFFIDIKSTSFFSKIFAVDDKVQTYVDYDNLLPGVFKLDIKDSAQVKEAKSYFDFETLRANYWEHKYTEAGGHEEKKLNWAILPYSQNPFSAIFYMRVFKWTVGKQYSFRVADDEKNVIFKATALEKTKLNTDAGSFNAVKIKAEVQTRGNLAKATDFYMWISDDEHKYILRIEVKLPVGSLVSEVSSIKEGK
ncbi:MAG: DUF3108 domain-containing protein [Pseudobdellovibrio sp.]